MVLKPWISEPTSCDDASITKNNIKNYIVIFFMYKKLKRAVAAENENQRWVNILQEKEKRAIIGVWGQLYLCFLPKNLLYMVPYFQFIDGDI